VRRSRQRRNKSEKCHGWLLYCAAQRKARGYTHSPYYITSIPRRNDPRPSSHSQVIEPDKRSHPFSFGSITVPDLPCIKYRGVTTGTGSDLFRTTTTAQMTQPQEPPPFPPPRGGGRAAAEAEAVLPPSSDARQGERAEKAEEDDPLVDGSESYDNESDDDYDDDDGDDTSMKDEEDEDFGHRHRSSSASSRMWTSVKLVASVVLLVSAYQYKVASSSTGSSAVSSSDAPAAGGGLFGGGGAAAAAMSRRLQAVGDAVPSYVDGLFKDLAARKKLFEETPPEEVKYWFEYAGPLQVRRIEFGEGRIVCVSVRWCGWLDGRHEI
jgi:hypothetical protein